MSVSPIPHPMSNPRPPLWLITVIVVVVIISARAAQIVNAYVDAAAFLTLVLGGVRYSNEVQQPQQPAMTGPGSEGPSSGLYNPR